MTKVYRIRRINLTDHPYWKREKKGRFTYLTPFPGTGRQYRFEPHPVHASCCGDQVDAINFPTLGEARKKMRIAAVKEITAEEKDIIHSYYEVQIVEVRLLDCEVKEHQCKVSEKVVWPEPPVLDRLAAI